MTPSELQHLRELCERATPGPWRAIHGRGSGTVQAKDCAIYINVRKSEDEYLDETVARWQRDAAFIAAARSAVPALIEEVERQSNLIDQLDTYRISCNATIASLRAQVADLTKERDENARELKHLRALFDEVKHQRDCYMRAAKRHDGSEF